MGQIALVIGGATCVFNDINKALQLFTPDFVVAINDIGVTYPRVDAWVTLHPVKMPQWIARRARTGHSMALTVFAPVAVSVRPPTVMRVEPDYTPSGLSGLYAVKVATRCLGAERVVLAGVPMDKSGHFLGPRGHWITLTRRAAWLSQPELQGIVKSMSGWTQTIFGAPECGM